MSRRPHDARQRGLATFVAVCMMLSAAIAVTALSTALAAEHRRTKDARTGAQLRMLLLAGEAEVVRIDRPTPTDARDVPTPVPGATLRLVPVDGHADAGQLVRVEAALNDATLSQLVTIAETAGQRRITDRRLDRLH